MNVNNQIKIFIIFRIHNYYGVNQILEKNINSIFHLLNNQGIDCELIDIDKYLNNLNSLKDNNVVAFQKLCLLENSNVPLTSFYYSVERTLGIQTLDFFKIIVNTLNINENSSISINLIPYYFTNDERNTINQLSNILSQIYNGVPDDYYGVIKDFSAKKHFENYESYKNSFANFKMVIHCSGQNIVTLVNPVLAYLNNFNEWICMNIYSREIDYYLIYPDLLLNEIYNDIYESDFWRDEDSPKSLFNLQFVYTYEEVKQFFNIPSLEDDSIKGIKINRITHDIGFIDDKLKAEGNIKIGSISNNTNIGLRLNDLTKHLFVSGVPGQGKTVFLQNLLFQLNEKKIPFLVIEPAKKEYRTLKKVIKDLLVFTPGNNNCVPFVVNPFIPPKNVTLGNYKSNLIQALEVAFDMEPVLKRLFKEVIENCYTKYGWRNTSTRDDNVTKFGMYEVLIEFRKSMSNKYDRETRERLMTAGVMRIKSMIDTDPILFDTVNSISIDEIIDKPCVIELNGIEDYDLKNLITSLLLSSLFAYVSTVQHLNYGNLNHLMLLEEAHVLLKNSNGRNDMAIELFTRILAENRAAGYCLAIADQSPDAVGNSVVRLTGNKLSFRTVEEKDRKTLKESMVMETDDFIKISQLNPGEAFFFNENTNRAILVKTDNFKEIYDIPDTISDEQCKKESDYWENNKEKSRPYNECNYITKCQQGCDYNVRSEGLFLCNRFYLDNNNFRKLDRNNLLTLLSQIERVMEEYTEGYHYSDKRRIINCAKCHILRKIYLEKDLDLNLKKRINLMKNKSFIKE